MTSSSTISDVILNASSTSKNSEGPPNKSDKSTSSSDFTDVMLSEHITNI